MPSASNPAILLSIAKVAHEVNRAYCAAIGEPVVQPSWGNAPEWQRTAAINGVAFHLANPNAGPEASHENWLREKAEAGWKWGPCKNPEQKEHPCMRPFEELPLEQRVKDHLFRAVVHAMGIPT